MMEGAKMGRDMVNRAKWEKQNIKRYVINLNKAKFGDVIEYLEKQPNKQEYLIGLIQKDMKDTN